MADIVNLRQARKKKRRDDAEREAAANRLLHGRTAGEKSKTRLGREIEEKRLDAHRRDAPPERGSDPQG
jgi:hypothetical protein